MMHIMDCSLLLYEILIKITYDNKHKWHESLTKHKYYNLDFDFNWIFDIQYCFFFFEKLDKNENNIICVELEKVLR
jgi:hypothetical protein